MIASKILVCLFVASVADEVFTQNTENDIHFVETQSNFILNDTENSSTVTPQPNKTTADSAKEVLEIEEPNFIIRLYNIINTAIQNFLSTPRVRAVFHNVGTCMVNGAMEIVTYYLPAPMIPLVASAAGLLIPFEPVITLREKIPVTSYRRAFNKAVSSFMGTFDKYKDTDAEDPYMTRRFNRRFLNASPEDKRYLSDNVREKITKTKKRYEE